MERASISALKNRLSAYLEKVRAGETVLVFDRDRPVARLEPVESEMDADDRITRLERAGLVKRGRAPVPLKSLRASGAKAKRSVTQALLDERRGGR